MITEMSIELKVKRTKPLIVFEFADPMLVFELSRCAGSSRQTE